MKIVMIGSELLHPGFASAGAECIAAASPQEALQSAVDNSSRTEIGVLLIAATLAEPIRLDLDRIRAAQPVPLILEIPDLESSRSLKTDSLEALMSRFGIKA